MSTTLSGRIACCRAPAAAIAVLAWLFWAGAASAGNWDIDYGNSRITFTAKQMGVPSEGEFKKFSVDLAFDRAKLAESKATVVVDIASVRTAHPDVETEVKKAKWFDVANHPTATFDIGSFRDAGGDKLEAVAKLTMRGVAKDVVLPFKLSIADDPAKPGYLLAKAAGEVEVKRLDFGIGQDEWRNTNVVANEVVIRIDVTARRPK